MIILGIETSCDDTSIGIVRDGIDVLAYSISSQPEHNKYGGIVPELAARAHFEQIDALIYKTMQDANISWGQIDRIAVTYGPGLVSSLLVGITAAKVIANLNKIELVAIDHLKAHICSINLAQKNIVKPPFVTLLASGGHCQLSLIHSYDHIELLGNTLDDSAGEAFDKGARLLGLDYPGGPEIDRLSKTSQYPSKYKFTYPKVKPFEFSFSGLKTALLRLIEKTDNWQEDIADIAYAYQDLIINELVNKAINACQEYKVNKLAIVGGVSANSHLRQLITTRIQESNIEIHMPDLKYCTDNGAMIASAGYLCPEKLNETFSVFARHSH